MNFQKLKEQERMDDFVLKFRDEIVDYFSGMQNYCVTFINESHTKRTLTISKRSDAPNSVTLVFDDAEESFSIDCNKDYKSVFYARYSYRACQTNSIMHSIWCDDAFWEHTFFICAMKIRLFIENRFDEE